MSEQFTWVPPDEPLAFFADAPKAEDSDNGRTFLVGARTIERDDGEVICPDANETALWGMIAAQQGHTVIVERYSVEHTAANRFTYAGLLIAEDDDTSAVTLRLHPSATIEDIRRSKDDLFDQRAVDKQPRTLGQLKAELTAKGFVLTSGVELGLPYPDGVNPATHVIDKYGGRLRDYHESDQPRLRATGLIAVHSVVDFEQSSKPSVPTYKGDMNKDRPEAYDFVDMLGDQVLRRLCEANFQLLPDQYTDLSLRYSLNVFRVFQAIARTAHTDGGVQNLIWRLRERSGLDGGWTYVLEPENGKQTEDGYYEERAAFACRLVADQMLIIDERRYGHTSKDNSGEDPISETVVLATLPADPVSA